MKRHEEASLPEPAPVRVQPDGSVNDPISQKNAVQGLVEWGRLVEQWRKEVKARELALIQKLNSPNAELSDGAGEKR